MSAEQPAPQSETHSEQRGTLLAQELSTLTETEHQPRTEYKFVFTRHQTPEDARRTVAELRDVDAIVWEFFGDSIEDRQQLAADMNRYVSGDIAPEEQQRLETTFKARNFFLGLALAELKGSHKPIYLIDADNDASDIMQFDQKAVRANQEFEWELMSSQPNHALLGLLDQSLRLFGQENALREKLVTRQLKALPSQKEDGRPVSYGIVMGTVHTPVYHELDHAGESVRRVFPTAGSRSPLSPGEREHYAPGEQIMRQYSMQPEKPADQGTLERILLQAFIDNALYDWTKSGAIVQQLSAAEVTEVLDQVDTAKADSRRNHTEFSWHDTYERVVRKLVQRFTSAS